MPGHQLGSTETRASRPTAREGTDPPRVAVIIPCLNAAATIVPCLDAIVVAQGRIGSAEVVLVDNGSSDDTPRLARERFGEALTILRAPGRTVGALRNLGTAASSADPVAFVDADCVIPPEYFTLAAACLDSGDADGVGGAYLLPPDAGWILRTWDALHSPPPAGPVTWLLGGNAVLRREALGRVGGFDERIITGEDTDLGRRLVAHGLKLRHEPRLSVVHLRDPRTIRGFCKQQYWHGIGMWQRPRLNRPLAMTLVHGVLTVLPIAAFLVGRLTLLPALGLLLTGQVLVPLTSTLYRIARGGSSRSLAPGVLLYELYYLCRLAALTALPRAAFQSRQP